MNRTGVLNDSSLLAAILTMLLVTLSFTKLILFDAGLAGISLFLIIFALSLPVAISSGIWYRLSLNYKIAGAIGLCVLVTTVLNSGSVKWTSVGYTFMFLSLLVVVLSILPVCPPETFRRAMRWVIALFGINIAIAAILYMFDIKEPALSEIFRTEFDRRVAATRFCGFASEPSYAAFIVICAWYAYLKLSEYTGTKAGWPITALVVAEILLIQSIYGYLLFAAVGSYFLFRRYSWAALAFGFGFLGLVYMFDLQLTGGGIERLGSLWEAVRNPDLNVLKEVDSSSAIRIVPLAEYWMNLDFTYWKTWLGHGGGQSQLYFTDTYFAHLNPDSKTGVLNLGFVPSFLFDYGIFGAFAVLYFLRKLISRKAISLPFLIFLSMLFNANFNTQLFWFVTLVFACKHYYESDWQERARELAANSSFASKRKTVFTGR